MPTSTSLHDKVKSYLVSADHEVHEESENILVAKRRGFGDLYQTMIVWTVPPGIDAAEYEAAVAPSLVQMRESYPDAQFLVLAYSTAGFSRDFRTRVKLRVPVQFFDTPFRYEDAPGAASAIAEVRQAASRQIRVPQPYQLDGTSDGGPDLLTHLYDELQRSTVPTVRVIVGRAGIGKSLLFETLFTRLFDEFQDAKRRQQLKPRPIPLIPAYIRDLDGMPRAESLVQSFIRTDVASPVGKNTLDWLLINGHSTWLWDGLDELYAGDPGFCEYLFDLITASHSQAQITIFCRDSLLTTSDNLNVFREACGDSAQLRIYRLEEWRRPSKRSYAWARLERRLPQDHEQDTSGVSTFLGELDRRESLRTISGLPFYCSLLINEFQEGGINDAHDEVSFLNGVVDRMIEREKGKGLLNLGDLVDNGLNDWLEEIALDYVDPQSGGAVRQESALEYGEMVVRVGLHDAQRRHVLTSLLQFPLFRAGERTGQVAFTHDLIAEALAARRFRGMLAVRPLEALARLGAADLDDPTLVRFVAQGLGAAEERSLLACLHEQRVAPKLYPTAISLLLLARTDGDYLVRQNVPLESQNLSHVTFRGRNLAGRSFRQSDLSFARFENCDLREAKFEGATLVQTRFDDACRLEHADFGSDLSRISSIWRGGQLIENPDQVREWISRRTGTEIPRASTCPSALQVLHLFSKFISPLGEGRRDELNERGMLAGRRVPGAPTIAECIHAAVREGYISGPDYRHRYRRAQGDKYAEMVDFVRTNAVSSGLGRLMSSLCSRSGCLHRLGTAGRGPV